MSILIHFSLITTTFDLGVIARVGVEAVRSSSFGEALKWLVQEHSFLIMYPLGFIVELFGSAGALLVFQAFFVSSGVFPVMKIARKLGMSEKESDITGIIYVMFPRFVKDALSYDFHPETLGYSLFIWLIWAIWENRKTLALVLAVFSFTFKENFAPISAWISLLAVFGMFGKGKDRRILGGVIFVLSVVASVGIIELIKYLKAGEKWGALGRYSWLGNSPIDMLINAVSKPLWFLETVFVKHQGFITILNVLSSFLFLPLLSRFSLLAVFPVAVHILSGYPNQYRLGFQYISIPSGLLFLASIDGFLKVKRFVSEKGWLKNLKLKEKLGFAKSLLMVFGIMAVVNIGVDGRYRDFFGTTATCPVRWKDVFSFYSCVLNSVPDGLGSIQVNLGPHFVLDEEKHLLFPQIGSARWVLIDERGDKWPFVNEEKFFEFLSNKIVNSPEWIVKFKRRSFVLFIRTNR